MVLSDDDFNQILRRFERKKAAAPQPTSVSSAASVAPSVTDSEGSSEEEPEVAPAVAPAPVVAPDARGHSSRSKKRGADKSLAGPSAKK